MRDSVSNTRHLHLLDLPVASSTSTDDRHPNKAVLRDQIMLLRDRGMSYREIGELLGLHWTRVGQIVKGIDKPEQ
ncbi:MAG: helix-turn-helix domain-containing protein [Chloroflexota bacterium]|nr:helix-turn-helix domain-containing protein [Chloroflexota bacterium]